VLAQTEIEYHRASDEHANPKALTA
jgi:hypothetical protein